MKQILAQRADPHLSKHNGLYYFTASVPTYDCIELRCSKNIDDLKNAQAKVIWTKHSGGEMSEHIWAPELHRIDEKWYIYFAAGKKENVWEIRPYVLECSDSDPISGKWIEKGKMQAAEGDKYSFTDFSLDGTTFCCGGERYFIWAEKVGNQFGISNLYIAKMQSPTKLKTAQVLLSTPDYDWERIDFWVNEAPAVYMRDGKIFITYSASATGAMYCIGQLYATENSDLLDPGSWVKERYPIFKTVPEQNIFGPGHNSFCEDELGEPICVFHSRPYKDIVGDPLYDHNRHANCAKIDVVDGKIKIKV